MKSRSGCGKASNRKATIAGASSSRYDDDGVPLRRRSSKSNILSSAHPSVPSQHRRLVWYWSSSVILLVTVVALVTTNSLLFRILEHIQHSASSAEWTTTTTTTTAAATTTRTTPPTTDAKILLENDIPETEIATKTTTLLKKATKGMTKSNQATSAKKEKKASAAATATATAEEKKKKKTTTTTEKKTTTAAEKKKTTTAETKKTTTAAETKKTTTTAETKKTLETKTKTSETKTTTETKNNNNSNKETTPAAATAAAATSTTTKSITTDLSPVTFAIRYRGPKLNATSKAALTEKWGQWTELQDSKGPRPALPCEQYSHCDVPRDKFPPNAWQSDPEFLKTFLKQAQELITRAQEAILAEYGRSKYDLPNMTLAQRSKNFQLDHISLNGAKLPPDPKKVAIDNGGWTTSRSFQGLVRRILHAIMTQDSFTFALGGHSAAAGHGNLFKQSYALQFHRVMEPVFGRLGVQLYSYNFAKGGRGTSQDSMGMSTLWGKEIDFCMWDAGMLELKKPPFDMFARQALIGGNRVPILWNGYVDILKELHNQADVDIGGHGSGLLGLPITESEEHAKKLPHALRYLRCTRKRNDLCDAHKYNGNCWVDRPDVKPPAKQNYRAGGQLAQHPGFRMHQLTSRVLAFTMLLALQEGLSQWAQSPNYELADSAWHVTAHYNNIRTKLAKVTSTPCFNDTTIPTTRLCTTPMKGVSEYMPRAYPETNSIRSIVTDTSFITKPVPNFFFGPDVYNPALEPPEGAVNYLAIIENDDGPISANKRLNTVRIPSESPLLTESDKAAARQSRGLNQSSLPVGRGWALRIGHDDIGCNGTYDSECGRQPSCVCLLYGHNDDKGGLVFDSLSGWLLMRLKDLVHGLILIKIETWQHSNRPANWPGPESSDLTEGWTEENNGLTDSQVPDSNKLSDPNSIVSASARRRRLAEKSPVIPSNVAPELCPEFRLEYAINGHIQSFNKSEFFRKRIFVQKLVETWTLLDDPKFSFGKTMDVDFAIRMQGCKRNNTLKLTHVYWS